MESQKLFPDLRIIQISDSTIVVPIEINLKLGSREALNKTGRTQYVIHSVANMMPKGNQLKRYVLFFKPGYSISDAELAEEYRIQGRIPIDPYSLCAINTVSKSFADTYPNATHWYDPIDGWCCIKFNTWEKRHCVRVHQHLAEKKYEPDLWFGAVCNMIVV